MKFCIANTSYWESIGYNPTHWRKSINGAKALCHLEYGEILAKKLEGNDNVQIYDNADSDFQKLLKSAEWTTDGIPEIIEDDSLSKRVSDLEKNRIVPLEDSMLNLILASSDMPELPEVGF